MAKFKRMDMVEQTNHGDYPALVIAVHRGEVPRYDLSHIDGVEYKNIPEYMVVKARSVTASKWGKKK